MADSIDDDVSFDPRSWGTAKREPVPVIAEDEAPSFDTRSWTRRSEEIDAAPPAETEKSDAPVNEDRRRWIVAGGLSAVILSGGGAFAMLSRNGSSDAAHPAPDDAIDTGSVAAVNSSSRRTLNVSGPDEIEDTLAAAGIAPDQVKAANELALAALGDMPGEIRLDFDVTGEPSSADLIQLQATRGDGSGLLLKRGGDARFISEKLSADLTSRIDVVRGEMDGDSFYTSAVSAGVTDSLISDFANAFSFDFNFQTEVGAGDVFEAAFEQRYNRSGDVVGVPTLVYVSLTTSAKSAALYRYTAPGEQEPGWYDGRGHSTVRALMRTPVDGARITSKFGARFHPILHFSKMHNGTDFAAPTGTPIYASGDATVQWAALKGANGNLTILRHDNGWQTYYLHQSRFMPGIVAGARVTQGQKIGEIGTTGRSTGPHLHYEVHIDGKPVDPMSIDTGTGKTLVGPQLTAFERERDRIDKYRASAMG